jgi:hypothetical protein
VLPGQLIWIPREGYFFSVFLPLLMLMSACTALIKKKSINILLLSLGAMVIDAIYHLAIAVYHIYCYQKYKDVPLPLPTPGTTIQIYNYWPSHIMLFIELFLILTIIFWSKKNKLS